jgi:hypothetical protein
MMRKSQPTHRADRQGRARSAVRALLPGCIFICIIGLLTVGGAFAQNANAPRSNAPGSNASRPHSPAISAYSIDGLALGARVELASPAYRGYQCGPSEQFPQFVRCQRTQKQQDGGARRSFESTASFMQGRDGKTVYINRHIAPWSFDRNEVQNEINILSSRFGERAHEMRMPQREGVGSAVIAWWGKIELEPLDADAVSILATGESPRKGLLVDYLGNLKRSAQLGLPVFSLKGGAGYLWAASIDRNNRGHIRFLTVDASALTPAAAEPAPGESASTDSAKTESAKTESAKTEVAKTESASADSAKTEIAKTESGKSESGKTEIANTESIRTESSRTESAAPATPAGKAVRSAAELASVEEGDRTSAGAEPANAGIEEAAAAENVNVDPVLARLEADLAAAQARSRAMTSLASWAIGGLIGLLMIFACFLLAWRKKTSAAKRQIQELQIKELHIQELQIKELQNKELQIQELQTKGLETKPAEPRPQAGEAQSPRLASALSEGKTAASRDAAAPVAIAAAAARSGDGKKQETAGADRDRAPVKELAAASQASREIPQTAALTTCSRCDREISVDDKFCMHCGAAASAGSAGSTRPCSSCRHEIGVSDKFCRHCGASSVAVAAPSMTFSRDSAA